MLSQDDRILNLTTMKQGRRICNVLKDIRQRIADANNISYHPHECHYQGECQGTCPACESEVGYLEDQLDLRRAMGKAFTVAGVALGITVLGSGEALAQSTLGTKAVPDSTELIQN